MPQKTKYTENVKETSNFELKEKVVKTEDQKQKLKDQLKNEQVNVLTIERKQKSVN